MKKVVLSIDVEDWYHLDYFDRDICDTSYSLLDGLDEYVSLLEHLGLPSSFFVLGEIADKKIDYFKDLTAKGHDIGSHGWNHQRPMTMSIDDFSADLKKCMDTMIEINGDKSFGYRAPCFSIDRDRLEVIKDSGFNFDSSRIQCGDHPLYGTLDMTDYTEVSNFIYKNKNFLEFEVTTGSVLGKNLPISGGGYLRILPWMLTKYLVSQHLKSNDIYILYIHPFELSRTPSPHLPSNTSLFNRFRFNYGRHRVLDKLRKLIELLQANNYEFTTFRAIHDNILSNKSYD